MTAVRLVLPALLFFGACVRSSSEPSNSVPTSSTPPAETGSAIVIPAPVPSESSATVSNPAPSVTATADSPATDSPATGSSEATAGEFVECQPEQRGQQRCTRDLHRVCARISTGITCVHAPCPAALKFETRSNPCHACRDPKVVGYGPGACPK